jgi:hypothetical protein
MRIIRLVFGSLVVVEGIRQQQWALAVFGGAFAFMALLNAGCCSSGACNVKRNKC